MHICVKCKKEMVCTYTGKSAVYREHHAYAGDEFTCPICDTKVLNCPYQPYQIESVEKWNPECYIKMD